ncbi:hypothetical protein TNCT_236981, partial [Trichonephila clavata]
MDCINVCNFSQAFSNCGVITEKGASTDLPASNGFTALDLARHLNSSDVAIIENLSTKFLSVG